MYLARFSLQGKTHYIIRESYFDGTCYLNRDLLDLGTRPGEFIVYPGGNAYYIHECVEEKLRRQGVTCGEDALDNLFWPFIDPRIRRIVESFSRKTRARPLEIHSIHQKRGVDAHDFDKRRLHYLRFGRTDQGNIHGFPAKFLSVLENKSRDELEQYFMESEKILRPSEFKTYMFVSLDLQRHFLKPHAKNFPEMLDICELDEYFIFNLCELNADEAFWKGFEKADLLEAYLVRYAWMFFDFEFGDSSYLQDYIKNFMDSRRNFRFPARVNTMGWDEASVRLQVNKTILKKMSRREVTLRYRKMVMDHHPDKGGNHEAFIRLTEAYKEVLKRKPKDKP